MEMPAELHPGLADVTVRGELTARNSVNLNLLQWLDVYQTGGGLDCTYTPYNQGTEGAIKPASKVQYMGKTVGSGARGMQDIAAQDLSS